jgi:hypothetical protein
MIKGSRRIGIPSCAEVGRQRRIDRRFSASRNVEKPFDSHHPAMKVTRTIRPRARIATIGP